MCEEAFKDQSMMVVGGGGGGGDWTPLENHKLL